LRKWGGADWEDCVEKLITLERAWGFPGKGKLAVPGEKEGGRLSLVKSFMRDARQWDKPMDLEMKEISLRSLKGSFAEIWWGWWQGMQPEGEKTMQSLACHGLRT
jgi:hypothetical protein